MTLDDTPTAIPVRRITSHMSEPGTGQPSLVYSRVGVGESAITRASLCLKYVSQGSENYHFKKRSYRLASGQFMVVAPGEAVAASIREGTAAGVCLFLPPLDPDDDLGLDALIDSSLPIILSAKGRALGHFLARLAARFDHNLTGASFTRSGLGRAGSLLIRDILAGADGFRALGPTKTATRVDLIRRVELARAHIFAETHREVTLEELAARCALSPHHLSRTFQSLYGEPPIGYHRRLRLERAFTLLVRGCGTIGSAAAAAGYGDHAAFTKAFTRQFGRPPSSVARVSGDDR